jgi:hypothetical protein
MEEEHSYAKIRYYMMVIGKMGKNMDMELRNINLVASIREIEQTINHRIKDNITAKMEQNIKDNGKVDYCMEKELINTTMDVNTVVNGL